MNTEQCRFFEETLPMPMGSRINDLLSHPWKFSNCTVKRTGRRARRSPRVARPVVAD